MDVYFLPIDFDDETLGRVYCAVEEGRRVYADSHRKEDDRRRSLGAGLLLRYARHVYKVASPIKITPTGKPAFVSGPAFSLSHSGNFVMLAVGGQRVGADLEKIEPRPVLALAERFFAPEEAKLLKESNDPADAFFALWTQKEAVIKADGGGFRHSIRSFSVVRGNSSLDGRLYTVDAVDAPQGYRAALAYDGGRVKHTVKYLTADAVLEHLLKEQI